MKWFGGVFSDLALYLRLRPLLRDIEKRVKNGELENVNWKTTLAGILTACGVGITGGGVELPAVIVTIGGVLKVVGPVLLGLFAADAKKTPAQPGQ